MTETNLLRSSFGLVKIDVFDFFIGELMYFGFSSPYGFTCFSSAKVSSVSTDSSEPVLGRSRTLSAKGSTLTDSLYLPILRPFLISSRRA